VGWHASSDNRVPGHGNWEIETAAWNLASFVHCALETRWQQFGRFFNEFPRENLKFPHENLNFLYQNLRIFL